MQNRVSSAHGFSVSLEGASLFDLVQFECLDHEAKILGVRTSSQVGWLYFRSGNLVHAKTGEQVGEAAVREMLRWENGQITHERGSFPAVETISAPWQSVLLRAAHALDESDRTDNVVTFPARESLTAPAGGAMTGEEAIVRQTVVRRATIGIDGIPEPASDGSLAETAAYVFELADLVGDALGLGPATAIEAYAKRGAFAAIRDADGMLRALVDARATDPDVLRVRLEKEVP